MSLEEIRRRIDGTSDEAITIDVREFGRAGCQRSVSILSNNRVMIKFELNAEKEGGLRYVARHKDLGALISYLEKFLGKPMREWSLPQ
jgi:hypothetical protein